MEYLTFVEAAEVLGVSRTEIRQLAVEDWVISTVRIDGDGRHQSTAQLSRLINIELWRVDAQGLLHRPIPVLGHNISSVGTRYERAEDAGALYISRDELERYRRESRNAGAIIASTPAPKAAPPLTKATLPLGLTPPELAKAFGGLRHSEDGWTKILADGKSKWLMSKSILLDKGSSGSVSMDARHMSRRNPVEVARYLLKSKREPRVTLTQLNGRFSKTKALAAWRDKWDAFLDEAD